VLLNVLQRLKHYMTFVMIILMGAQTAPYNLFQIKPTRCTLPYSICISTSVYVSGNYMPIIRRTYCIYATLVALWVSVWSADRTAIHYSLVFSLEGRAWQEPETSHVTGMALAHCILGKLFGVVCHCFPPPLDVRNDARDPSNERWNCGRE